MPLRRPAAKVLDDRFDDFVPSRLRGSSFPSVMIRIVYLWLSLAFFESSSCSVSQITKRIDHFKFDVKTAFSVPHMNAISPHVKPMDGRSEKATTSFLQAHGMPDLSGAISLRDYDPKRDEQQLRIICKDVYGGRDYMPRMIYHFVESENDYPMVLEYRESGNKLAASEAKVMALGNVQIMDTQHAWVQGIRTDPAARGMGFGTKITKHLTDHCQKTGVRSVWSSTTQNNAAMQAIFRKLGYQHVDDGSLFPTSEEYRRVMTSREDAGPFTSGTEYLEALGFPTAFSSTSSTRPDHFTKCESLERAEEVLKLVVEEGKRRGLKRFPLIMAEYRIYAPQQVEIRDAIDAGRAWVTTRDSSPALAVARRSLEYGGRWVLSVCAVDSETIRAGIVRGAQEIGSDFTACFPAALAAGGETDGGGGPGGGDFPACTDSFMIFHKAV